MQNVHGNSAGCLFAPPPSRSPGRQGPYSEAKPDVLKQLLQPGMPQKIPVNHQGVAGGEWKVEGKSAQVKNTGMRDSTIAVSVG